LESPSTSYHAQEIAIDGKLDVEDRGLMFMTAHSILDGNFGERGHRAPSTLETSMAQAAHTVYE